MSAAVQQTDQQRKSTLIAILLTCVAYAYFNIGDAAVKLVAEKFHFSQIIIFNCVVIIACMCVYGWIRQGPAAFVVRNPKWVLVRAVMSVIVSVLNIYALPNVQLTTFYTLVFTSPLWVAVLSMIFLGEKVERQKIAVILFGLVVIMFIFRPGGDLFNVYALMILLSAFIYSCSMIVMRYLGPHESRTVIICSGSLVSILCVAPFLPFNYITPTLYELGIFFLMGVLGAIGVTCIAYAFQNAPSAATVAPYHYTQIVWGALLGYFMFGEVPDRSVMIGAVLIIAAGLYLILSETRRRPPPPLQPPPGMPES